MTATIWLMPLDKHNSIVSFVFGYACAPLHNIIEREEHESISSCHFGDMGNSLVIARASTID